MSTPAGKLRVAVVGAGFGKAVHVPAFRLDSRCEIVAIVASTEAKARAAADELGVPRASGEWRQIVVDPMVDAVTVALPPVYQVEVAAAALAAGKHVFLEKPLASSATESERLVKLADEHGSATAVDFEFPEIDAWREAKRRLEAGVIGPIRHVTVSWRLETYANRNHLVSWKTSSSEGGGTLGGFVSHTFYYVEWLLGPIARLWAELGRPVADPRAGDTVNTIAARTASGIPVAICVATDAFLGPGHRIEIYGESGTLVLENQTSDHVTGFELSVGDRVGGRLARVEIPVDASARLHADGRIQAVSRIAKRFVDAATGQGACTPNVRHGQRVQTLLDLARESDMLGRRLSVPIEF